LIPDPDPDRQGSYISDPATGNPVHSRLEETTLQKLAAATNGRYLRLGQQGLSRSVVMQALSGLETMETGSHEESKPIERFYWPLLVGIIALMLSLLLRPAVKLPRLSPTAVGLLLLWFTCPIQAAVLSLSQTVEQAEQAYRMQDFARARDLYARLLAENPPEDRADEYAYGLGASAHQLKDYDRAIESFSHALRSPSTGTQQRAHQSLGNALYEQGAKALQQQPDFTLKAWVDSLSHY
jgi:Ca-activated chloride channel family protein